MVIKTFCLSFRAFFFQAEEPPSIKVSLALATVANLDENESEPATRSTQSQSTEQSVMNSQLQPECNIDIIQSTPRGSPQQSISSQNRSSVMSDPSLSRIEDGQQVDEPMETDQVDIVGSAERSRRVSQRSSQRQSVDRRSAQSSQRDTQDSDSSLAMGDISENRRFMEQRLSDPTQSSQNHSSSHASSNSPRSLSNVTSQSNVPAADVGIPEFTQEELDGVEDGSVTNNDIIVEPDNAPFLSPTDSDASSDMSN